MNLRQDNDNKMMHEIEFEKLKSIYLWKWVKMGLGYAETIIYSLFRRRAYINSRMN